MPIFFRVRHLFIVLVLITGCVRGQKQNSESSINEQSASVAATFYYDRAIVGESKKGEMSSWETPLTKIYRFTACFKDRTTKSALLNQPLVVSDEHGRTKSLVEAKTDNSGCLSWNDTIAYNYFADSKYVEILRTVKGSGAINRGEVQLKICVDPWAEQDQIRDEVLDCQFSKPPKEYVLDTSHSDDAFSGLRADKNRPADVQLWLDNPRLTMDSSTLSADRARLSSIIHFKPGFVKRLINGARSGIIPLPKGIIKITPFLKTSDNVDGELNHFSQVTPANETLLPREFANGDFGQEFSFSPKSFAQICNQQMGLRVEPINAPMGNLRSADFIFHVGDCSRWTFTDALLRLDENVNHEMSKAFDNPSYRSTGILPSSLYFLDGWDQQAIQSSNTPTPEKINPLMNGEITNRQFVFEPLYLRFDSISRGETATNRTLVFTASTCVHNAVNRGQRLGNFHFDVYKISYDQKGNKTEEKLNDRFNDGKPYATDDSNGCVTWKDSINHEYYIKEHYYQAVYELRHVGSDYSHSKDAKERQLTAVINPWDYGFTFGRDISYAGGKWAVEAQESLVNDKPASRMVIYNFKYETINFRYEIDEHMNLTVQKNVLFRIEPQVIRMHSIVSGRQQSHESLRNGYYLLKTALQKYYDDHGIVREYLDTFQKIVQVQGGVIVAPTKFSIADLRLMRVRNNLLVELQPVNEHALCRYSFEHDSKEKKDWPKDRLEKEVQSACEIIDLTKQFVMPPESELDQYVLAPEQTGLSPRTFVGPVIPQSNSFSSNMWPTDSLDESDCTSEEVCRELTHESQTWQEEKRKLSDMSYDPNHLLQRHSYVDFQKYFESATMRPLKGMTVTSLIKDQKQGYNAIVRKQADLDASVYSAAQNLNSEYMQILHPETVAQRFDGLPIEKINRALPVTDIYQNFLKQLNGFIIDDGEKHLDTKYFGAQAQSDYYVGRNLDELKRETMVMGRQGRFGFVADEIVPNVSTKDFLSFFETGKMNKTLALRLCAYWFHDFFPKQLGLNQKQLYRSEKDLAKIDLACKLNYDQGAGLYQNGVFAVDQRLKIDKIGDYNFEKGMSVNININTDKRRQTAQDVKRSFALNVKLPKKLPLNTLALLSGARVALPTTALTTMMNDALVFLSVLDGNFQLNRGETNGISQSHSSAVTTTLAVQMAKFNVTLSQYEQCRTLSIRPEFLQKQIHFFEAISPSIEEDVAIDMATRGILICTGEPIVDQPRTVREVYYYVSQNFNEGDMMDTANIKTHPWLLQLRGNHDFAKFMSVLVEKVDLFDVKHLRELKTRIEAEKVEHSNIMGTDDRHHLAEPEGEILQAMKNTRNEPALDMNVPVEARASGQMLQRFKAGIDPRQLDERQKVVQQSEQARLEFDKVFESYKQNNYLSLDNFSNSSSRSGETLEQQRLRLKRSTDYSAQNAINFNAGSKSEADRRWSSTDLSPFGVDVNNISNTFLNGLNPEGFDKEMKDYPIKKLGEIYAGTPPSVSGFITITEDSLDTGR